MRATVLVADDQADVREALALVVQGQDWLELVGVAADADEAIGLAERHQPDVALLDVRMPAGGGPRAASEIAVRSPSTKVVALSAYEDRGSVFQMLRAGAVGYVVKGASAGEISQAIERVVKGEGVLSPQVTSDVVHTLAEHLDDVEQVVDSRREIVGRIVDVLDGDLLKVVHQPIVRLETDEVVGYEALARFPGERPPNEWFADAATVGLSTELEVAAVATALSRLSDLPREAFLTVNVGPAELVGEAMSAVLASAPAGRVVVEVTEHAAVSDYELLKAALEPFRARGGRLAVDDAGAGFASLRHVLALAPDFVKIDGSLVRELHSAPAARALAASLAVFAQEMGIAVVAEGIEAAETIELLAALGIEYGQGFHLGVPEVLG